MGNGLNSCSDLETNEWQHCLGYDSVGLEFLRLLLLCIVTALIASAPMLKHVRNGLTGSEPIPVTWTRKLYLPIAKLVRRKGVQR